MIAPIRAIALLILATAGLGGCATRTAVEDRIVVAPAEYSQAFEVAGAVVRDMGLSPDLRSRRTGIIETVPARAASILEPWDPTGSTLSRRWEGTLSHERRRARIEFGPAGGPPPAASPSDAPLTGPDLLGLADDVPNLMEAADDLELRVWVFVERAHEPGIRRSTWSRRLTTRATVIPTGAAEPLPSTFWTPVARDRQLEHRILAEIRRRLAARG